MQQLYQRYNMERIRQQLSRLREKGDCDLFLCGDMYKKHFSAVCCWVLWQCQHVQQWPKRVHQMSWQRHMYGWKWQWLFVQCRLLPQWFRLRQMSNRAKRLYRQGMHTPRCWHNPQFWFRGYKRVHFANRDILWPNGRDGVYQQLLLLIVTSQQKIALTPSVFYNYFDIYFL